MRASTQFRTLLDWHEGRLGESESGRLAALLESPTPEELQILDWLRRFSAASERLRFASPGVECSRRLRALFVQPPAPSQPDWSTRIARLVKPLLSASPAHGFRGEQGLGQFAFESDSVVVTLDLLPGDRPEQFHLAGQIGGISPAQIQSDHIMVWVHGAMPAAITRQAEVDAFGEFLISDLQPGRYDLVLFGRSFEILLPAVEVG